MDTPFQGKRYIRTPPGIARITSGHASIAPSYNGKPPLMALPTGRDVVVTSLLDERGIFRIGQRIADARRLLFVKADMGIAIGSPIETDEISLKLQQYTATHDDVGRPRMGGETQQHGPEVQICNSTFIDIMPSQYDAITV